METLILVLVIAIALILIFWLLDRYVAPAVPEPFRKYVLAVVALIVIILLIQRFIA